ncbi:hypothetical protein EVAR_98113_1 [Eumeta japonica]|uniref:Uncharacterized protein n=1 Tax=Eumeta variegata TaxID=151549 RepID=A0A4C1XKS3_EUMVA|nr:hypothetical protein EVAR_98113_1 [Eumeta japonica]
MRISSLYRISIAVKYAKAFSAFIQCHHIGRALALASPQSTLSSLRSTSLQIHIKESLLGTRLCASTSRVHSSTKQISTEGPHYIQCAKELSTFSAAGRPWVHAHLCALELRLCHTMFLAAHRLLLVNFADWLLFNGTHWRQWNVVGWRLSNGINWRWWKGIGWRC